MMLLTLVMSNTTMDLSAYTQHTLLPSTDIVTLLTSGCFLFIASIYLCDTSQTKQKIGCNARGDVYVGSSAKGRGSVALYSSVSVSNSLTIPSLHPHAMMSRLQAMDDAPETLTSTHLVSARSGSNM